MNGFFFSQKLQIMAAVIVLLFVGLALDLKFHGLAWRLFYSVTGEEAPANQLYGFVLYLANPPRAHPVVPTTLPINYSSVNPLGMNTFLDLEVEPAKRQRQLQMIADAGFGWIRQQFRWEDIEIEGRGNFTDTRNGLPVDAWKKYDNIVDLADQYHLKIIARLGVPPKWSEPPRAVRGFAPPTDMQDFVNYAVAVATRYQGRIQFYQVWNEPNIYPEWGEQVPNPEAYTDLLCRTYRALTQVDPSIAVISGTLAQTIEMSDRNLNDLVFLQRMYQTGAAQCFDILGAQAYGLFSGPTNRRIRPTQINFARVLWLRDMMIANGDAKKPIWIGEMAWNPVPDAQTVPDVQYRMNYGQVNDDQAARYAVEGYRRAREEWPFVGVINYWYFKMPDESRKNEAIYYFRMVDPDFTPRPVYQAIKAYATSANH